MTRLVAVMLVGACVSCMGATQETLLKRAAFDLNCKANNIEIVTIDKRTRGVTGCAQRVTYVETCRACANGYPSCDCTWVLNGDARKMESKAAAPAKPTPTGKSVAESPPPTSAPERSQ